MLSEHLHVSWLLSMIAGISEPQYTGIQPNNQVPSYSTDSDIRYQGTGRVRFQVAKVLSWVRYQVSRYFRDQVPGRKVLSGGKLFAWWLLGAGGRA